MAMPFVGRHIVLIIGLVASVPLATALPPGIPITLTASESEGPHQLGYSVDIDGDTAIAGAWKDDEAATDAGAVYVFRWAGAGWILEAKLLASDAGEGDEFGTSVSIDGNTIVVGSPNDDGTAGANQGSAYVFTRSGTTWTERTKLTASDAAFDVEFGASVALDDGVAVLGAPRAKVGNSNHAGAVYVFADLGDQWHEQQRITANAVGAGHAVGTHVAVDGDTIVASAHGASGASFQSGAAYVFRRNNTVWEQEAKLFAAGGLSGEGFGSSVVVLDGTAVIGASTDNERADDAGAAYVFTRAGTTWSERTKLMADDAAADDFFGSSLAIHAGTVLVGAWGDDYEFRSQAGAAYVFHGAGGDWTQRAKLTGSERLSTGRFGVAVALDGNLAMAGAPLASLNGFDSGSAHIFSRVDGRWIGHDFRMFAEDGTENDLFGSSVAIDGDTAVVGAIGDDGRDSAAGATYVLARHGSIWIQQAKLTASDGVLGDEFGRAVAIDGDTLIVGAPGKRGASLDEGAAYVFVRTEDTWSEQQKLVASEPISGRRFGFAVDIEQDSVIVGAPSQTLPLYGPGAAYVFTRTDTEWAQLDELTYFESTDHSLFGYCVAIDGNRAFVGEPRGSAASPSNWDGVVRGYQCTDKSCEYAYVFSAPDRADGYGFGWSLAVDGDTVAVGTPFHKSVGRYGGSSGIGAVYVGTLSGITWTDEVKLSASDAYWDEHFGRSVALDGDMLMIGAVGDDELGALYVFSRLGNHWTEREKVLVPDSDVADHVGYAVAVSDGMALVAAEGREGTAGLQQGAVWFHAAIDQRYAPRVFNAVRDTVHETLEEAVQLADAGDALIASSRAMSDGGPLDLGPIGLSVSMTHDLPVPDSRPVTVSPDTVLSYPARGEALLFCTLDMQPGALLRSPDGSGITTIGGPLSMSFATISADAVITKTGQADIDGVALINGDVTNSGALHLGGAALFISESLDCGGVINDEPHEQGAAELRVHGDLALHVGGEIVFSTAGGLVGTTGDFDVAIADHNRFDLSLTELWLDGPQSQALEVMSADIGPSPAGLNRTLPGHYPIGTLRIGPGLTIVDLTDNHDNDGLGQSSGEAIYVNTLIVEVGAALNTNGYMVYYNQLSLAGSVNDTAFLIPMNQPLPGDCDVNGSVTLTDFARFVECLDSGSERWSSQCECFDLSSDGFVNLADVAVFQEAFTGDLD